MLLRSIFFQTSLTLLPIVPGQLLAQKVVSIQLPALSIVADRIERGDGDTYGLGDWRCDVKARLEDTVLVVQGAISFTEKANDFTTITGAFSYRFVVPELETYCSCALDLEAIHGSANGPNIGARGYRWFEGQGIIRRARIRTDTLGDDSGHIGGTLDMGVLRVAVRCGYATVE